MRKSADHLYGVLDTSGEALIGVAKTSLGCLLKTVSFVGDLVGKAEILFVSLLSGNFRTVNRIVSCFG